MNAGLCQTIVGLWNVNPVSDWWESLRGAFKGSPDCSAPPGSVKPPPRTGGGRSDRGPSRACLSSSPEPSRSCSCWDSPGEMLSQTTVGLSHTVTQYSQGKAFEKEWGWGGGGSFPAPTAPLCCAAEEPGFLRFLNRGPLFPRLPAGACVGGRGDKQSCSVERLVYQLPEMSNKT